MMIGLSKEEIENIFQEKSSSYGLDLKCNRELLKDFVCEVIERNNEKILKDIEKSDINIDGGHF